MFPTGWSNNQNISHHTGYITFFMRIIYFPYLYMWYPLSTIFILKKKLVQHNILLITMYHMSIALHNTPKWAIWIRCCTYSLSRMLFPLPLIISKRNTTLLRKKTNPILPCRITLRCWETKGGKIIRSEQENNNKNIKVINLTACLWNVLLLYKKNTTTNRKQLSTMLLFIA